MIEIFANKKSIVYDEEVKGMILSNHEDKLSQLSSRSGLSENVLNSIIIEAKSHGIKELRLFGSRAGGDHDEKSDIDLAAYSGKIESFKLDIEDKVPTLLTFDVVDMERSKSKELKDIVKKEGIVIYEEI